MDRMDGYDHGWCDCPHCPDNTYGRSFRRQQDPYHLRMPSYSCQSDHQHYICQWCDLFDRYAPDFEGHPLQVRNMEMLNDVHDFFMGTPRPPYLVSAAIKDIAEQIALWCSRRRLTSARPRKLVSELFDLAAEVRDGQWSRGAMDSLGRTRRRGDLLGHRRDPRAIGWYGDGI